MLARRLMLLLFVCGLFSVMSQPTFAQEDSWEAYVLVHYTEIEGYPINGYVLRLTSSGNEIVGDFLSSVDTFRRFTPQARLSPNKRYLLLTGYFVGNPGESIVAYDLQDGLCCFPVQMPVHDVQSISLGGFSPDSRYFSYSYVRDFPEQRGFPEGGMVIIDIANVFMPESSISLVQDVPMSTVNARLPEASPISRAFMSDWEADGIRFIPNCYGCESVFEGQFASWDPFTDTFSAHSDEYFSVFGASLDVTGEMFWMTQNRAFPYSEEEDYFPIPNVIEYSPSGTLYGEDTRVIFHDPSLLDVGTAHWVMGGRAILVRPPDGADWRLVHRNGTVEKIDVILGTRYFAPTETGWLLLSGDEEGNSLMFSVDGTTRERTEVAMFGGGMDAVLLSTDWVSPEEASTLQPFGTVVPPDNVQAPTSENERCSGFLPSRLIVGENGRVTPGTPNRIRDVPALENSRVVGEIPGEGVFEVLEGPVCDPAGIAWWRVRYNDIEGWSAEGQDQTYFTEPLP